MANEEMEKLLERVYKDIDLFDFNGKNVPRIILDDRKFDDMMSMHFLLYLEPQWLSLVWEVEP